MRLLQSENGNRFDRDIHRRKGKEVHYRHQCSNIISKSNNLYERKKFCFDVRYASINGGAEESDQSETQRKTQRKKCEFNVLREYHNLCVKCVVKF